MSKPPPHHQQRKMRRAREYSTGTSASSSSIGSTAAGGTSSALSGFELYEAQGNAAAAYQALYGTSDQSSVGGDAATVESTAFQYNRIILRSLAGISGGDGSNKDKSTPGASSTATLLLEQLEAFSKSNASNMNEALTARKRKRNECIMAYNRALILYATGKWKASAQLCQEQLEPFLQQQKQQKQQQLPLEIAKVASRLAMLWLEALLACGKRSLTVVAAKGQGGEETKHDDHEEEEEEEEDDNNKDKYSPDDIIHWLEGLGLENKNAEFKFLLSLYKGRVDLAARTTTGLHEDPRVRSARKELKIAMEVFQHKLRLSSVNANDSASVVSSVDSRGEAKDAKEDVLSSSSLQLQQQQPTSQQQQQPTIVLQKLQQSALNLKASLEQLKGNVKKSLILCQEAHFDPSFLYYNAIHANNLAVVYQTSHKRHLALHVLSKALQSQPGAQPKDKNITQFLACDGTATPALSLFMVWNAALCALQARSYLASYECWATCLADPHFDGPLPWLRLAEACLGLYHEQGINSDFPYYYRATPIQVHGKIKGLVIGQPPAECTTIAGLPPLGSPEDLDLVTRQPLRRARFALELVLRYPTYVLDKETLQTARLSLAYVSLCSRDFERALELGQALLDAETDAAAAIVTSSPKGNKTTIGERVRARRCAAARLYIAEAYCGLGDAIQAMKCLVGPYGQDARTLDRLACDLGGVTLEMAAASSMGKRRLARAQTVVRSSASAVTAAVGNIKAAKQLAMSAQAMEDAMNNNGNGSDATFSASPPTKSLARRALVYCLLRERNNSAALSLLQHSSSVPPWAVAAAAPTATTSTSITSSQTFSNNKK